MLLDFQKHIFLHSCWLEHGRVFCKWTPIRFSARGSRTDNISGRRLWLCPMFPCCS